MKLQIFSQIYKYNPVLPSSTLTALILRYIIFFFLEYACAWEKFTKILGFPSIPPSLVLWNCHGYVSYTVQCFVYELTLLMMSAYIQVSFSTENLTYDTIEKIFIVLIWLLVQIPGNIMLLGIIQFDQHGGDPLKRRIHDQVWKLKNILSIINIKNAANFSALYNWKYHNLICKSYLF